MYCCLYIFYGGAYWHIYCCTHIYVDGSDFLIFVFCMVVPGQPVYNEQVSTRLVYNAYHVLVYAQHQLLGQCGHILAEHCD